MVPVLSRKSVWPRASVSRAAPPFTAIPRLAALDTPDTMAAGAASRSGARGGDHEHRQRAGRVSGNEPGRARDRQRQGHEELRIPVGQADKRSVGGLGLAHHADEPA